MQSYYLCEEIDRGEYDQAVRRALQNPLVVKNHGPELICRVCRKLFPPSEKAYSNMRLLLIEQVFSDKVVCYECSSRKPLHEIMNNLATFNTKSNPQSLLFFDSILQFLIDNGADVNELHSGSTPALTLANGVGHSQYESIRPILKKLISLMNPKSLSQIKSSSTLLSVSIEHNDASLLSLIIERGGNICGPVNYLQYAINKNSVSCFKALLAKGHPKIQNCAERFVLLQEGKLEPIEWKHDFGAMLKFEVVPEYADVRFYFPSEDVTITGHKCILYARSKYLEKLIKDNLNGVIEIKDMTSETFKMLLEFFYTGNITITLDNVFFLVHLADQFAIEDIPKLCEAYLTNLISVDLFSKLPIHQVVDIYLAMQKYPNYTRVEAACLKYFQINISLLAVINEPRGHINDNFTVNITKGSDMRNEFLAEAEKINKMKLASLGRDYWLAFSQSPYTDVTLVFADKEEFKTCRVLLHKFSDYFRALMTSGMKDSLSESIFLEDIPKDVFLALMEFLTTGDASVINGDNVVELLSVAEQFYCDTLKLACQRFIQEGIDSESVCSLLEVADSNGAEPLSKACLWYILVHYQEMSTTEAFAEMVEHLQARVYEVRDPMKTIEIFAKLALEDEKREEKDFRMLLNVSEAIGNLAQEELYASAILKKISFDTILSWTNHEGSRVQIEAMRAIANFALHASLINTTIKALPVWKTLCKSRDRTVVLQVSRGIANVATVPEADVIKVLIKNDIVSVLTALMETANEFASKNSIVGALHNIVTTNKETLPFISIDPIVVFLCKSLQFQSFVKETPEEKNLFYKRCLQLLAQILTSTKKLKTVAHKVEPLVENTLQALLEDSDLREAVIMLVIQLVAKESRNRWTRIISVISAMSGPSFQSSDTVKQLAFILLLEVSQWGPPKKS